MFFRDLVSCLRGYQIKRACLTSVVGCIVLLSILPYVMGWLGGNVIGGLFAPFLARHDIVYWITEHALSVGYTLLAVSGIDFLFLFMTYMSINTFFERNGSWKDIAEVSLRALKYLLLCQSVPAILFLVLFGTKPTVYVYSLIPPFLTQSVWASIYMMMWELSLLLFAFGYAVLEECFVACKVGGKLALGNFMLVFAAAVACIIITWLPGICFSFFDFPTWVLIVVGVTLQTLFFNGLLVVFLQRQDVIDMFAPSTED